MTGFAIPGLVLPVMIINSIRDIKEREIYLWLSLIWCVCGLAYRLYLVIVAQRLSFWDWSGFLFGGIVLVIAFLSKEAIGIGDGIIMIGLGLYLTSEQMVYVLIVTSFVIAIVAVVMLVVFHKKKTYSLPLVPFLTMSAGVVSVGELICN